MTTTTETDEERVKRMKQEALDLEAKIENLKKKAKAADTQREENVIEKRIDSLEKSLTELRDEIKALKPAAPAAPAPAPAPAPKPADDEDDW